MLFLKKKFLKNKFSSFRRRKFTKKNINILKNYWPIFGINLSEHFILNKKKFLNYFKNFTKFSTILEIGFGSGDYLISQASKHKNVNFIGIELYIPGIISCLKKIIKKNLNNIILIYNNAEYVLKNYFVNNFFKQINIFFPDPWPKNRHKKRRIISLEFLNILYKKIVLNGELNILTDCTNYFDIIKKIVLNNNYKKFFFNTRYSIKNTKNFVNTKFFKKAIQKKSIIHYLNYSKFF
ncbi:tRNA (guanosine(46)-N7)-methyltransferase TrmB [Buchnera aphidicola]|uniref:tRNA (guanosine(46)-N7)-methyltransferase TrmB n=1 Tax=Buchnera aphidicola TaxID=9 RepID=UPI0030EE5A05